MTDKLAGIIKTLTSRTLAKQVIWSNTNRETEFQVILPSGRLTVDHWTEGGSEYADFRIYNSDGVEIAAEAAEPASEDFKPIVSLHNAIITRKLNVEETLAGLEKELAAEGTIGEDEIPF